jgi:hygromycin-B 4-O-kinase
MATSDAAARDFVAAHYGSRATGLWPLAGGEWSRAFAAQLDGRPVVIRFGQHVGDFKKDAVMAGYASEQLPIPAVSEIGATGSGYFAVSGLVRGEPLDGLDERAMRAVLPGLLAALDAIRGIEIPGSRGYGIWLARPDGCAGSDASWAEALLAIDQDNPRLPGWRAALSAVPASARCFDRGYASLAALANGLPARRHVVHADLLNRNVLVAGPRLAAVLDWGNAMFGDWLYDAAWLIFWWPWFPRLTGIDITAELLAHWAATDGGSLPPGAEQRLHAYQLHIGLDSMAYTAFRGRREDLARVTEQVAGLLSG